MTTALLGGAGRHEDTEENIKQRHIPSLHGLKRREVPGTINNVPVNAVPGYGSSIDAISEGFAREHGMEIQAADKILIKLPAGRVAESVGLVVGDFKFQGESQTYTRHFRVLGKCAFDMVLGREFLEHFCHRIVERVRPCVQKWGRLFLLDESPKDRIRCTVNGSNASAYPDTGSDLMLVSGDFARRNNLKIHRGREYRNQVELADGSLILTDGMVLDAELEFDMPPMSLPREVDLDQYLEYDRGLTALMKEGRGVKTAGDKSVLICDLHVVDGLPCDIILSSDFIFDYHVFSQFKHLFSAAERALVSRPSHNTSALGGNMCLEDYYLLFMQMRNTKKGSWFFWGRRRPATPPPLLHDTNAVPLEAGPSWEGLWEVEEARRNQMQLWIGSLPDPLKSDAQRAERQRQEDWDKNHPRLPPSMRLGLPSTGSGLGLNWRGQSQV
ncbi:hypothetical protein C8A00DRAFT_17862 [Chaetomidium leptoderma]|uniref:Uncharacterized protein n=1 Tax=Chaetomidium leptoderma TaxID=669021 RepID=A0AAN6VG43_9PEZI|nr:hypothetical protein C8A00DRAFT_17862 [Chaetomidium leptoderma]